MKEKWENRLAIGIVIAALVGFGLFRGSIKRVTTTKYGQHYGNEQLVYCKEASSCVPMSQGIQCSAMVSLPVCQKQGGITGAFMNATGLSALDRKIEDLTRRINITERNVSDIREDVEDLKGKVVTRKEAAEMRGRIDKISERVDNLTKKAVSLKKKYSNLLKKHEKLSARTSKKLKSTNEKIDTLKKEVSQLESNLTELKLTMKEWKETLKGAIGRVRRRLSRKIEVINASVSKLDKRVGSLEGKVSSLYEERERISGLPARIKDPYRRVVEAESPRELIEIWQLLSEDQRHYVRARLWRNGIRMEDYTWRELYEEIQEEIS